MNLSQIVEFEFLSLHIVVLKERKKVKKTLDWRMLYMRHACFPYLIMNSFTIDGMKNFKM